MCSVLIARKQKEWLKSLRQRCIFCGWPMFESAFGHAFCINEHVLNGEVIQPVSPLSILNTINKETLKILKTENLLRKFYILHNKIDCRNYKVISNKQSEEGKVYCKRYDKVVHLRSECYDCGYI